MDLTTARARLPKYVDDKDGDKYDSTEIDDALKTGQTQAWTRALSGPRKYLKLVVTKSSDSSGLIDLTTQAPRKIVDVSYMQSQMRLQVMPARIEEAPFTYKASFPFEIHYLPDVTFPVLAGDPFVWGDATVMPSLATALDALMILYAAQYLKPKENELLGGMDRAIAKAEESVDDAIPSSSWTTIPADSYARRGGLGSRTKAPFKYLDAGPHKLQLVLV